MKQDTSAGVKTEVFTLPSNFRLGMSSVSLLIWYRAETVPNCKLVLGSRSRKSSNVASFRFTIALNARCTTFNPASSLNDSFFTFTFNESSVSLINIICVLISVALIWSGVNPLSDGGTSKRLYLTCPWRIINEPIDRSNGLWDVVSSDASASSTNWKLGTTSSRSLYRLAIIPKSCAEEMEILPWRTSIKSIFTDILAACNMRWPLWSSMFTSSMMTRLGMPTSTRPTDTSVPNFADRAALTLAPR